MGNFFHDRRISLLPIANKKSEKGIALLLSLLMSFIIAFALSIELLNTRLNKKSFALNLQQNVLFYTIEKNIPWSLSLIKTMQINKTTTCFFSESYPDDLPKQLDDKKISGCTKQVGNVMLGVAIEDLGFVACMHAYRLSILGEDLQGNKIIMQIIEALPENNVKNCQKSSDFIINSGRQSWRIVSLL